MQINYSKLNICNLVHYVMETIKKIWLYLCVILILGCSSSANKFVGKWKLVGSSRNEVAIIEEKENGFDLYSEKTPDRYISFTYDKERDLLTSNSFGGTLDLKFESDKDHIVLAPRMRGLYDSPQHFERIKD